MVDLGFRALEYCADTGLRSVDLRFVGSTEQGFEGERNGEAWLRVGPG